MPDGPGPGLSKRAHSADRQNVSGYSGGLSSPTSLQEPSGTQTQGASGNWIQWNHKSISRCKGRSPLVGQEFKGLEWPYNDKGQPTVDSRNRCIFKWMGSILPRRSNRSWSSEEQNLHINFLEMLAIFFALKAFLKAREGVSVLILSDNMSVVAHVNKMGGTRSQRLVEVTKRMFAWCLQRRIKLQAQHLPGKANITADFLSRHLRDRTDWVLNANIFRAINLTWGPLQVDLFAPRFSAQLRRFFSWRADPEAEATDTFSQNWSMIWGFAHPPWCLIAKVLTKVQREEATVILVAPLWRNQPWFPSLLSMLADQPIILPDIPDLIIPSPNCNCPVLETQPQLIAWKVSGITSVQRRFQTMLSNSSCLPGEANYNSAWKKWKGWCKQRGMHPFAADVSSILGFLADQFEEGRQYRSLNCYRSALCSIHLPVEGFPVGQHPLVVRLLKGAYIQWPPKPKYSQTWDVTQMLAHLRSLGGNETLSLKLLTQELARLLALVLGHRSSDLVRLTLWKKLYPRGCHATLQRASKADQTRQREVFTATCDWPL